jgi:hypothetical protein
MKNPVSNDKLQECRGILLRDIRSSSTMCLSKSSPVVLHVSLYANLIHRSVSGCRTKEREGTLKKDNSSYHPVTRDGGECGQ